MKKIFICLIIIAFNISCAFAKNNVITGSVSYTVETAKDAAFSGLDLKIDRKFLEPYLKDTNNKENRDFLKKGIQPDDRSVISFEIPKGALLIKGYGVIYDSRPEYTYYYSTSGYLVALDIDKKQGLSPYPYKIGKYNPVTGSLVSVALFVSDEEQYIYLKNGKLQAHWIGNVAYNAKGKPIAKRNYEY